MYNCCNLRSDALILTCVGVSEGILVGDKVGDNVGLAVGENVGL